MRLRSCRRTSNPYSSRNEIVGTTNRSIEAIASVWFRRNVLQPCDGGRLCRAMYLATELWPTSMPSLRSSPSMRGAPQKGFAAHLADQLPSFEGHLGPAGSSSRLPAPERAESSTMPSYDRPGPNNCHGIENSRREPIQQYKDKPIERFEGRALGCAATQ